MVTPWLPDTCLTSIRATEPIAAIIEQWAQQWFDKAPWRVLGGWDEALGKDPEPFALLARSGKLEIKGRAEAKLALAMAITGIDAAETRNAHDERFLRDLGTRAIEDLEARIAQEHPASPDNQTKPMWSNAPRVFSLLIGTVGHAQIAIECSMAELVRMARRTFPASLDAEPLEDPIAARDRVEVSIAAQLGTASITLRELAGLEAGDLLILDSMPGDSASLLVEDRLTDLKVSIRSHEDQCLLEF